MSEQLEKKLALIASASQNAFVILVKCLMKNGALKQGQFRAALKETFNEPDADLSRLDYQYLQILAELMQKIEAEDPRES
jgi:hypothetical protein